MPSGIYPHKLHTEERKRKMSITMIGKNKGKRLGFIPSKAFKKGNIPWIKGKKHSEEARKKQSQSHLGKKLSIEHRKKIGIANTGKRRSSETKKKDSQSKIGKSLSIEHCKNLSKSHVGKMLGEKNPRWKGGITPKNKKIRHSIEYKLFIDSVFARDGYTCQKYGTIGGKLHAHHILNFSKYPELRFAIDNGITFSEKAHQEFHRKYGRINNTLKQLNKFLKINV